MALTILGLFFLLTTSLQNIGAGYHQNLMASDDQYLDLIVSFWETSSIGDERELLCIGGLIASNWIFVTKTCHDILRQSIRTVICTGKNYFDETDIHFDIKGTIEFPRKSKFVLLVIDVDIEKSSSFKVVHMESTYHEIYHGVLVGWSKKNGQPLIEPFTFTMIQNKISIEGDRRNKNEIDFPEGSFAVMGKEIMAVSRSQCNEIRFNKILSFEAEKIASYLRNRNKGNMELQCSSVIDSRRKIKIKTQDYINILVSLWKMISDEEYYILCLGALIKPNLILTTTQCSDKLHSLKDVGILTGRNNLSDTPERILSSKRLFRSDSKFILVVLNREIELLSSMRIGVVTTSINQTDKSGVLLGWNKQKGRINKPFSFKNEERWLLIRSVQSYSDEDFPLGSIAIQGRNIIGFTYLEEQNNDHENGMVQEITTTSGERIVLSKITYADFTKVHLLPKEGTCDENDSIITDVDYFNFVVSLWGEKAPRENNIEKFDLLCLGALMGSTLILVNNDCFTKVSSFSLENIGILTRSMRSNRLLPKTKVFIHHYLLRDGTKYTILVMNEKLNVLSHIKVDWLAEDDTENYHGMLVGWNRKDGPVMKRIHFAFDRILYIPLTAFADEYELSNFPVGSLVIMGTNFKASTATIKPSMMVTKHGIMDRTKSQGVDYMWTCKFTQRDSSRAKMILHGRKKYTKNRKSIFEMGSSSKKTRIEKKLV